MRAATKHINTHALTHNLNTLADLAPKSRVIAVVKANAYGCEAPRIADTLSRADLLAVAAIEEALAIREADCEKTILLLEGAFEENEVATSYEQNFELVIATLAQLEWLLNFPQQFSRVWLKLDTGMGRLGFPTDGLQANNSKSAMSRLLKQYKAHNIVLMTHFSDADSPDKSITEGQIARFDDFANNYPDCEQCLCNSAGTLAFPNAHRDYIRVGLALYGASPFSHQIGEDHGLKPVMTLKTRVLSVKLFTKGDPIGYGQTYKMPYAGRIAVCEIGYADGYLRYIPTGTPIRINSRDYSLVGRVSMDMITVLVDEKVAIGDEVICWGEGLPIERVSEIADTIPYQLLTTVTARPRVMIE